MNVCIIGRHGFIGSALEKKYLELGATITSFPTSKTDFLYHLGSPVHPPFEENVDYHTSEILSSFIHLLPFCRDNKIKFIYSSSALVYEDKDLNFIKVKKMLELFASMYPETLGLRIFPVYGPGENRTVISQWCKQMKEGNRPLVWGDGSQMRDFIYIDDAISQIVEATMSCEGVVDIGAGLPMSFNYIIKIINNVLGTDIEPGFVEAPIDYAKGIVCKNPGEIKVSLKEGIERIING